MGEGKGMTFFYSVLHLLVDGVCALAMFGSFLGREDGYFYILVYNFCAFALQMPFGVVLDSLQERERGWRDFACLMAGTGVLCTLAGAVTHPAVLGIGNALFHVGGGVGVIREDRARGWRGRGLGVFVAPGALGLFLGTQIAGTGTGLAWTGGIGILMALLCLAAWRCGRRGAARTEAPGTGQNRRAAEVPETIGNEAADGRPTDAKMRETAANAAVDGGLTGAKLPGPVLENLMGNESAETADRRKRLPGRGPGQSGIVVAVCCLAVVALRSYVGMAVALPWKSGMLAGVLAVLAVVGGKMAGGFAGAEHGMRRTAIVSLGLAAVCYLGCAAMPLGLAALFLFNMTMPVTLYWLVCSMPGRPGFAFGFLTFALFLGFLPVYFGLAVGNGNVLGCGGSILSLLLLAAGMGRRE